MKKEKGKKQKKDSSKKSKKKEDRSVPEETLNVIQDPYEFPSIHQEMADLFDEDKVTHQHGGTEPESD